MNFKLVNQADNLRINLSQRLLYLAKEGRIDYKLCRILAKAHTRFERRLSKLYN